MPEPKMSTQRPIDTAAWKALQAHYEKIKNAATAAVVCR